jgi:hypothetical protein
MAEPRYEAAAEHLNRIGHTDSVVCADCGAFVINVAAHTRFHSILGAHAWALAVLKNSHITVAWLHAHGLYAEPCDCGEPECGGWAMSHPWEDAGVPRRPVPRPGGLTMADMPPEEIAEWGPEHGAVPGWPRTHHG